MKIGALAKATATPIETIRFYEREGLLPAPARAQNNYRWYLPAHVERLAFIRQCRTLDMTLDEIRALIQLREAPAQDCGDINTLLDEHIGHVAQRIHELRLLQTDLKALRARCSAAYAVADCGILDGLDRAAAVKSTPAPRRRHLHGAH
jgi:Cd(II)/Pb(II)-responsive transcriptional regulator